MLGSRVALVDSSHGGFVMVEEVLNAALVQLKAAIEKGDTIQIESLCRVVDSLSPLLIAEVPLSP